MERIKITDINSKIKELKLKYGRNVFTNIVSLNPNLEMVDAVIDDDGIVYIENKPFVDMVYFMTSSYDNLKILLKHVSSGARLDIIYKDSNKLYDEVVNSDFSFRATYIRQTVKYNTNPYEVDEIGKRKILQKMYDPNCGELAKESDIDELYNITVNEFDIYGDDVFSKDEWKDIIQNEQCYIYRGEGKIRTYYVYRDEGKKMYVNIAYNSVTANYLYNIERRVRQMEWDKGVRTFYHWIRKDNRDALERKNHNPEIKSIIDNVSYLYDDVFIKN